MHKTQPTMAALIVNQATTGKPVDLVDAFRSLESTYHMSIQLTHTGILVRSRGAGLPLYRDGDWRKGAGNSKARGEEQCADMRGYAIRFMHWAMDKYHTPELQWALQAVSNGTH